MTNLSMNRRAQMLLRYGHNFDKEQHGSFTFHILNPFTCSLSKFRKLCPIFHLVKDWKTKSTITQYFKRFHLISHSVLSTNGKVRITNLDLSSVLNRTKLQNFYLAFRC